MANTNSRSYPKGIREIRYPSNDIIQRFTSKDYTGTLRLNNETGLFEFDPPLEGIGGASSGTTFVATQAAHGFTIGQPIYHDGIQFKLANASADDTLAVWVVVEITSDDAFRAAQSGRFTITGHGLAPGNFYFVGTVDGGVTPTEPAEYSNPIIYVETVDVIHVLPYRPSSSTTGSGGGGGSVDSVFGRVGTVTAQSGDYTKDQVGLGNVLNVEQIPATDKGANNGVAGLDGGGKVPLSQLPVSIQGGITIVGFWNADTNTPNLSSLTLTNGQTYQVSVGGSTNLNGITSWSPFDLAVWDNTIAGNWFRLSSSGQVSSVNSQTGDVVLNSGHIAEGTNLYYTETRVNANANVVANTAKISAGGSIGVHSDVDVTTVAPANGQALVWDGANWVPGNAGNVSSVNTQVGTVVLDADDISDSTTVNKFTTASEISKLAGIESGAQANNINDVEANSLIGMLDTDLHRHAYDRARANHIGTQTASTISDFQSAVDSNITVIANNAKVSADASISTHSDVDTNTVTPTVGKVLLWDGSNWIPGSITGTLPSGNGGDMLYYDLNNNASILSAGTPGQLLQTNGDDNSPTWVDVSGGGHEIYDENGIVLPQVSELQFIGATTENVGDRTVVTIEGLSTQQALDLAAATEHINGADEEKHGSNQIINAAALVKLGTAENAKVSDILAAVEDAVIPVVASGEKVVTRTPTEILVSTEMVEQIVIPGTIASADWSLDQATYPGLTGQITYDETYKYECKGLNTWVRYDITLRDYINAYLANIDDSTGERTDAQLNAFFPTAQIGQVSFGTDFYKYEKITSTTWRRYDHGKYFIRKIEQSAIAANTTFIIPLGFKIDTLIIRNNTANSVALNLGTSTGGTDVINGLILGANAVIDADLLIKFFSTLSGTTLYLESADWNSANIDFKLLIKRVW